MENRFDSLPMRLKSISTQSQIAGIPTLLIRKDELPRPFIIWLHGRTADKELDPGRYLRYVRRGINVCAVDLPGHGERFESKLQEPQYSLDIVMQMAEEIDSILEGLATLGGFAINRVAIGGMSAGGMATIIRLLQPHTFKAAILEATMGSWETQQKHPMFSRLTQQQFLQLNPINRVQDWQEIPLLTFHSRHDKWVPLITQSEFIDALKQQYTNPELIEFVTFDHTGAPYEHMGFGRQSAFVKEVQVEFIATHLQVDQEITT